jgi:transposase
LLGAQRAVVESVVLEQVAGRVPGGVEGVVVARVRPHKRWQKRCPHCDRACAGYDAGEGRRRWRALDLGTVRAYLEADAPRVNCPEHGVVVAAVPWARHGSRFTRYFEDTVCWLAARTAGSTVAELMATTWRSVTSIVERTVAWLAGRVDRLDGLSRICIDEVSYRKGHRYLLRVTDADTGRQVWAADGRNAATLTKFFTALGVERAKKLKLVAADGAEWIHSVVTAHAPNAVICLDPYHVVAWANEALTELRRQTAHQLKTAGRAADAVTLKGSRWALVKNPEDLTPDQRAKIAQIAKDNKKLYTGYLIKEQAREIFKTKQDKGMKLLAGLIAWCSRSRCTPLVEFGRKLARFRELIRNTCKHGLSNAKAEATNNIFRLLTRQAFGYHSPQALIAISELRLGGLCPPLPGRT